MHILLDETVIKSIVKLEIQDERVCISNGLVNLASGGQSFDLALAS